jgi:hypothetical protein
MGARLWAALREWVTGATAAGSVTDRRLVLMLGVLLNGFPMHAVGDGASRLYDDFEVVFAPGIGVLRRRLGAGVPAGLNLLAVRNPTAASSGLKWAEVEVDEVRRVVPNPLVLGPANDPRSPAATRKRVMEELPRYAVGLLATHGI